MRVVVVGAGNVGRTAVKSLFEHLTALMFLGRIEIVPLAVLLHRSYWRG